MLAYSNGNNLFPAKADGSESRKIITVGDSGFIFNPVWSPDGNHLRFTYRAKLTRPVYFGSFARRHRFASLAARLDQAARLRVLRLVDCRREVLPLPVAQPNLGIAAKGRFSSLGSKARFS